MTAEEKLSYNQIYYQKNKERLKEKTKAYHWANREKCNENSKKRARARRLDVLSHYSNGGLKCACCEEAQYEFLCIDHINNGGSQHRREIKTSTIYQWLITNNYPDGFQVLCNNCNMAKGFYGHCPHQQT